MEIMLNKNKITTSWSSISLGFKQCRTSLVPSQYGMSEKIKTCLLQIKKMNSLCHS